MSEMLCKILVADPCAGSEAERLAAQLARAAAAGAAGVLLDLTRCASIDSTALGVLLRAVPRIRGNGRELVIVAAHPETVRLLRSTGIDRRVELSVQDAPSSA